MVRPAVEFSEILFAKKNVTMPLRINELLGCFLVRINILDRRVVNTSTETCIILDCAYCTPAGVENLLERRDGYVDNQGLNHWHTVSWDPGVADSRVLTVCYDCLCLIALFWTVMSLPRDWVEMLVWTGHDKGYGRSSGWELRYLPRLYPPCVVHRVADYLTEIKVPGWSFV